MQLDSLTIYDQLLTTKQPSYEMVKLPPDITALSSEQLAEMFTVLTGWADYFATQQHLHTYRHGGQGPSASLVLWKIMGNAYKRYEKPLTSAVANTVLTVPAATTAIVKSIWIANTNAASTNITVTFSPGGSGTHYLVPLEAVAPNKYVDLLAGWNAGPLVLEQLDALVVTSSQSTVFVVVSALLVDRS
jgi:hypothetical protein